MVVFTCNHCGETLQKPRVAKHYQFQCRNKPYLTCVDCLKDFHEQEYVQHTKCITEAERYGGKNYVPKPTACKGERKQQEWLKIVNNVLETNKDLSNAEKSFLQALSKCENIPRKKVKFINFINNAFGFKTNKSVVESVWAKMEKAYQQAVDNNIKQEQIGENQNNENIFKESKCDKQDTNNGLSDNNRIEELESSNRKKKSKKRKLSPSVRNAEESSITKKNNMDDLNVIPEPLNESQNENTLETTKFNWKNTILNIVSVKGEISLKKLQKRVRIQYTNHCQDEITDEKFINKFNKKLNKMTEIIVFEQKIRLA
ncbi:cell growth-regulating nucleolar protein isoform X1 [Vespula maculifrons]|uniref:Cell growth-regulating nucleolar protein isoform X1 n=1 Tax=Vespula maculifrons TaxID=7453 RepID=A0ABD2BXC5_VESMC